MEIVSGLLSLFTGLNVLKLTDILGCSEPEPIFLGCEKISRTDLPVCVCAERPQGRAECTFHCEGDLTRILYKFLNGSPFAVEKLKSACRQCRNFTWTKKSHKKQNHTVPLIVILSWNVEAIK